MTTGAKCIAVASSVLLLALASNLYRRPDAGAETAFKARWEVTVTNLTRGQILSPPVVAAHTSRMAPLFTLGAPASPEVVAIAEDAVNDGLLDALASDPAVATATTITGEGGPILPGESASAVIETDRSHLQISLIGMLVTTNDGFYALQGVSAPLFGTTTFESVAYDAGSEANNESCQFIPGPPCGNAGVRAPDGAEGYVHVHAGIHGIGDLDPAEFDWRNPVAAVTIRALHAPQRLDVPRLRRR